METKSTKPNSPTTYKQPPKREVIKLAQKAKMVISKDVCEQIRFLHQKVGEFEWSGILAMQVKGAMKDVKDIVATVEGVFPCDVGGAASTEYNNAEHMQDFWAQFPSQNPMLGSPRWDGKGNNEGAKVGLIHTHHNLSGGAYFSTVDMTELQDNVSNHGLYISLIVSFDCKWVAKGAFIVKCEEKVETKMTAVDFDLPMTHTETKEVEKLVTFDFELEFETEDWLVDRVADLLAAKAAKAIVHPYSPGRISHNPYIASSVKSENMGGGWMSHQIPGVGEIYECEVSGEFYYQSGAEVKSKKVIARIEKFLKDSLEEEN